MKFLFIITVLILFSVISSGCATMLKGYEDDVRLISASDSLQIFTKDGDEVPIVTNHIIKGNNEYFVREISLRSNQSHTLILKTGGKEKKITIYPKLGFGWVFLDIICGGFPSFYDAYTGDWNKFSSIDASMK